MGGGGGTKIVSDVTVDWQRTLLEKVLSVKNRNFKQISWENKKISIYFLKDFRTWLTWNLYWIKQWRGNCSVETKLNVFNVFLCINCKW